MALTVEDGTGVLGADSYASVESADAYHLARGNTAWTGTTSDKEIALRRATAAIDQLHGANWIGQRIDIDQSLDWPRTLAYDARGYLIDGLPTELVKATCEAALRELTARGSLTADPKPSIKRERVEGAVEREYFTPHHARVAAIDALLTRLVRVSSFGMTGFLIRA